MVHCVPAARAANTSMTIAADRSPRSTAYEHDPSLLCSPGESMVNSARRQKNVGVKLALEFFGNVSVG